jgi:hypothetical protein
MTTIKTLFLTIFALALLLVPAVGVSAQESATKSNLCDAANLQAPGSGASCDTSDAGTNVTDLVNQVIDIFSWIVGIVSVLAIIYGGFRYITSGGDASGVSAAKNTILYAIVGLVIVAIAQLIVKFVIGSLENV